MRRSADGAVSILHFLRHRKAVAEELLQVLASALQSLVVLLLANDNIELRAARLVQGIDDVGLACCSQRAALVENLRQAYFGRDVIVERLFAESCSFGCILAGRVASLNHKVGDDTMEEQRIVEVVFADKLQKVVAVLWRLVVELDADVAHSRLNQHLRTFSRFDDSGCVSGSRRCLSLLCASRYCHEQEKQRHDSENFHKIGMLLVVG